MLCFAELTCKVDAIYYATSSAIKGVFSDGNSTVTIISESNAKLNYDSSSERLLYYDGDNLISVKLDGSNATIIAPVTTIERFAVDHITRSVYYITDLFRNVRSIDLDTGADNPVSSYLGSGVEDLDTDPNNRYLSTAFAYNTLINITDWFNKFFHCAKFYFREMIQMLVNASDTFAYTLC